MACCGAIQKKPIVLENGEIGVGNIMVINVNSDHRFGDAGLFAPALSILKSYIEDPENFSI